MCLADYAIDRRLVYKAKPITGNTLIPPDPFRVRLMVAAGATNSEGALYMGEDTTGTPVGYWRIGTGTGSQVIVDHHTIGSGITGSFFVSTGGAAGIVEVLTNGELEKVIESMTLR